MSAALSAIIKVEALRLAEIMRGMIAASLDKLGDYALPSVMRKIVNAAVKGG